MSSFNENLTDKSWIGNCFISKLSKTQLLALTQEWIENRKKNKYIIAINVGKFASMQKDKKLRDVIQNSTINIADGFPIYMATRLLGNPIPEHITGADFMMDLLRLANECGYRVYFFGSKPHVLEAVVNKCKIEYQNLKIAGMRDGYFKKNEEEIIVENIAASEPDILLLALGVPQKEYFVADYIHRLNTSVTLPVGGAFDILAGQKKRAPQWVRKMALEWLWRSVYDKTRAGLVYKSFITFAIILVNDLFHKRLLKRKTEN